MKLIGLGYKKQSGKSTVGKLLAQELGGTEYAFADHLKLEVSRACLVPLSFIEKHKAEFRPMLQWWGTTYRRKLFGSDDYWITELNDQIEYDSPDLAIITDVRFLNEAQWIKSKGGLLIKVQRIGEASDDTHPSETELDSFNGWDYITLNDPNLGLEELTQRCKQHLVPFIKEWFISEETR